MAACDIRVSTSEDAGPRQLTWPPSAARMRQQMQPGAGGSVRTSVSALAIGPAGHRRMVERVDASAVVAEQPAHHLDAGSTACRRYSAVSTKVPCTSTSSVAASAAAGRLSCCARCPSAVAARRARARRRRPRRRRAGRSPRRGRCPRPCRPVVLDDVEAVEQHLAEPAGAAPAWRRPPGPTSRAAPAPPPHRRRCACRRRLRQHRPRALSGCSTSVAILVRCPAPPRPYAPDHEQHVPGRRPPAARPRAPRRPWRRAGLMANRLAWAWPTTKRISSDIRLKRRRASASGRWPPAPA